MSEWYFEKGPDSDIVISSRVRLARNFKDYPFPFKLSAGQSEEVINRTKNALINNRNEFGKDLLFYDIGIMNMIERQALVEKHLVSPEFINGGTQRALIINKEGNLSIMINEEDHLRIQSLFTGMQIDKAWELCNKIDTILEQETDIAFDDKFGYLTCCPTNIGTGIRASAMLHLPALTMTGYIKGILDACGKLGIAVRGIYGEHSEALGDMFQISNQVTLGQTEEEIITNIISITYQIIEQEKNLRNELYKQNSFRFEDKVYRSLGILFNARLISSEETLKLLSDVRLGVSMGIIKGIEVETLNLIMIMSQAANLQKMLGKALGPDERDVKRAEFVRNTLSGRNIL